MVNPPESVPSDAIEPDPNEQMLATIQRQINEANDVSTIRKRRAKGDRKRLLTNNNVLTSVGISNTAEKQRTQNDLEEENLEQTY